jgi:HAE1 family hydrophobic/amphiphilic exporter-1
MARGEGLLEATLGAVRVRFRPVIMTSMAFFFGVLPLAIATGAGAGAMKAIGTAVTGGMLSATFIDLFYIPLLFVVVTRRFKGKQPGLTPVSGPDSTPSLNGGPGVRPSPGAAPEKREKTDPNTPSEGR